MPLTVDQLRAALAPEDRAAFDDEREELDLDDEQIAAWERWRQRVRPDPDPSLLARAARVARYAELRGSDPRADPERLAAIPAGPGQPTVALLLGDLIELAVHTGADRPLPLIVHHQGSWRFDYVCAGRHYWVEGRSGTQEPEAYAIYDMGAGRVLDRDKPLGLAATQPEAAVFVRTHRLAQGPPFTPGP